MLLAAAALAERHTLTPTPKTVHWGYYDARQPPALHAGRVGAVWESRPVRLTGKAGRSIVKSRTACAYRSTWKVRTLATRWEVHNALNPFLPGLGVLPEDFPYVCRKIVLLDEKRTLARLRGSMPGTWATKNWSRGPLYKFPCARQETARSA